MRRAALLAAVFVLLLAPAGAAERAAVPAFAHVVVIVFENKERGSVLGNPAAHTFNRLARTYATLDKYYAVTHPSLPNYLALVSGSTFGIRSNCTACLVAGPSLAATLEAVGGTWKTYAEGLPRPGYTGPAAGRYAKKHNPFLYFRDVLDSPPRRNLVVPLRQMTRDLAEDALPDFALVVPDLCHSMHDCSVAAGDAWLARVVEPLLQLPSTVVFVVFDEGASSARGGGHIPALAIGTAVVPGASFRRLTGHCGLLRTIEDAWALPRLGCSARVAPISGIFR